MQLHSVPWWIRGPGARLELLSGVVSDNPSNSRIYFSNWPSFEWDYLDSPLPEQIKSPSNTAWGLYKSGLFSVNTF